MRVTLEMILFSGPGRMNCYYKPLIEGSSMGKKSSGTKSELRAGQFMCAGPRVDIAFSGKSSPTTCNAGVNKWVIIATYYLE